RRRRPVLEAISALCMTAAGSMIYMPSFPCGSIIANLSPIQSECRVERLRKSQTECTDAMCGTPVMPDQNSQCPVARALDIVGDRWTFLVLRDLRDGARKFHELQ